MCWVETRLASRPANWELSEFPSFEGVVTSGCLGSSGASGELGSAG